MLSIQTSEGLQITTRSFVSLTKDLLQEDGAKFFLPEKLNQDRLEVFFGKLRHSLGDTDNPRVDEARHRNTALMVAGRHGMAPKHGNSESQDEHDTDFLPIKEKKENANNVKYL